jgi:hypothetical protein
LKTIGGNFPKKVPPPSSAADLFMHIDQAVASGKLGQEFGGILMRWSKKSIL